MVFFGGTVVWHIQPIWAEVYWMWETNVTKVVTATWTFYLQIWQIDLQVCSLKTHMLSEIADLFLKNRTKQENFIHLYPAPGNCSISPLMNKKKNKQFLSPTAGPELMTPHHFMDKWSFYPTIYVTWQLVHCFFNCHKERHPYGNMMH